MLQTLVLIPHEFAGLPIFGFGWLLILLTIGFAIRIATAARIGHSRSGHSIGQLLTGEGLVWASAAALIWLILPRVELTNLQGQPVGMAIRGYGVMLLCGVVSAIALAAYRASRRGIDPDVVYGMAPWAFIGGIVGARIFYVVQYRDKFIADSIGQTIGNVLKFTEGGLVVYGSFIGGTIAVSYYIFRHRLPLLKLGDVIVPCLFIGVFFGRIGCLMNGCCYGGRCEDHWAAVQFPPTSEVYHQQLLESGELLGFSYNPQTRRIESVAKGTLASEAGIVIGSKIESLGYLAPVINDASLRIPSGSVRRGVVATIDGKQYRWTPDQLPARALPVYAVQVLSSASSLVLCLMLCGLSLFVTRDGAIMMIGFACYAVLRFVLELIRVDEAGQFGTSLSISQWVSIVVLASCLIGLIFVYRRPASRQSVQTQPSSG